MVRRAWPLTVVLLASCGQGSSGTVDADVDGASRDATTGRDARGSPDGPLRDAPPEARESGDDAADATGKILDTEPITSGAIYGQPDLLAWSGDTVLVYLKSQQQPKLPGSPYYARPFVQVLHGDKLAAAAVPIDFSAVTVANATTVYDATGQPVASPPAPAHEFLRHVNAGVWVPTATGGHASLLLSAAEPRITDDPSVGYCDPSALEELMMATATTCAEPPTWRETDRLTGPGWGLFQNLWLVEVKLDIAGGAVTGASALKATRLTYQTLPQTSADPPSFTGTYGPHVDPSGAFVAWTQVRAFGTGGALGHLGTYVAMAAALDVTGASPVLRDVVTAPQGTGSASGYPCSAVGVNNYQEVHGFVGHGAVLLVGNLNGQNESDQDLGLAALTTSGTDLVSLGVPARLDTLAYNEGNWTEGSAYIPAGPFARAVVTTSNKSATGKSLYSATDFPCAGVGTPLGEHVDYQILERGGGTVQLTSFNALGTPRVANATLAGTGVAGATSASVTEVVADPGGSFVIGGLTLKGATRVVATQLWFLPLE